MFPSIIGFHLVIAIYIATIPVPTKPYENGFRVIMELLNTSNINNRIYNDTPIKDPTYTSSSSLVKSKQADTRKLHTKSIHIWKGHLIDYKDIHNISRGVPFQNEQGIATPLESQQNKFFQFNRGKYRDRSKEPSHINIRETTALLPTQVTFAQQSVLVKLLVDKMTLTSEHRLARNCKNASDSVQVPPVVRLLNYIAERYLYHCTSVILYDDFYEAQFYLLRALFSTYPLAYMHGKVEQQRLTDVPHMGCTDFLLLVRNLKTAQAVVGGRAASRVILVSQASAWRVREFLSSRLSQNLVNLLVIGNQNQVSHGCGLNSYQNLSQFPGHCLRRRAITNLKLSYIYLLVYLFICNLFYQPPVQWVSGVLFPRLRRGRVVTLTTHPHLVPRSRISGNYTSSPPSAFVACSWTALAFLNFILHCFFSN
jgi:hypothetical protein